MQLTREWLLREIESTGRPSKIETNQVMVQCPFHANGEERTPSCKINLDPKTGYPVGSFVCYACGMKNHSFKPLADALAINYEQDPDDTFTFMFSQAKKREMLGEEKNVIDPTYTHFPAWDAKKDFRGMKGKLVNKLGCRLVYTEYGSRAYFPVFMFGKEVGGITATLEKNKYGPSYIYTGGPWVKRALFPYDHTAKLLRKYKRARLPRVVIIGEGTRDALNPLGYKIPALMNFGGKTTWSKKKADYILALEPDLVVLGFDPDEIGKAVTEMAYNDLHNDVPIMELALPEVTIENGEKQKQDLGALTRKQCETLKRKLGLCKRE